MQKQLHRAKTWIGIVVTANIIASIVLFAFLVYSMFWLHPNSIGFLEGTMAAVLVGLAWLLIAKVAPLINFILPLVVEFLWHGNSWGSFNDSALIVSLVLFANVVIAKAIINLYIKPMVAAE